MREPIRDKERLQHILDAIGVIEEGISTYSRDELLNKRLLYYGLVKQLEISHKQRDFVGDYNQRHPIAKEKYRDILSTSLNLNQLRIVHSAF